MNSRLRSTLDSIEGHTTPSPVPFLSEGLVSDDPLTLTIIPVCDLVQNIPFFPVLEPAGVSK